MMAYVDTNVILVKYLPHDSYHKRSTAFLELFSPMHAACPRPKASGRKRKIPNRMPV